MFSSSGWLSYIYFFDFPQSNGASGSGSGSGSGICMENSPETLKDSENNSESSDESEFHNASDSRAHVR